ncbi:translesion DNA synthesis-associated protein ImuA [Alteromonas pelagimontana]|uniref:Translesion DNA synthesis-associated protein ImuA n=1 Tax=Alteromonas pelagimontana TaxID=1858656 RepID=A0A6M4MFQ3_9ALTE|nr:translesion DNA synthesis-associated protein ImuA [Alteromonas pelagimontana]QJR81016.1 translesion DNA synthesis-associated protein ImuA [Alteromonas pelagimontana]
MSTPLTNIEKHPLIWRASQPQQGAHRLPTGHSQLDQALMGGLPVKGLIRIRSQLGIGEVSVLTSVIKGIAPHKLLMWINPPGNLHASWLQQQNIAAQQVYVVQPDNDIDALWACEQSLKSEACYIVLIWQSRMGNKAARRLQLAAAQHNTLCIYFESDAVTRQPLPLALDIELQTQRHGLTANIVKNQGSWPKEGIPVELTHTPSNKEIILAMQENPAEIVDISSLVKAG